jgi:hypothetical protein
MGATFLRITAYNENAEHGKRITISIFMLNWRQNCIDAKLIICTTFPDKPGEGSMQALKFGHG